jgi:YVTN family beta-propeller protein
MRINHECFLVLFSVSVLSIAQASSSPNPEQSVAPPGMIFELLALNEDLPTAARPKYLSPCDIVASPDGKYLYVAEQTAKQIAVVDFATKTVLKNIKMPNEVTGIAVAPDGKLVYVTCSSDWWPNGMVCEVSPWLGRVLRRFPGGHGSMSPVISNDGKTLYACNQYDNDVSVIDIGSGMVITKMAALRAPNAAAITPDDSILVVTNSLPIQKSTDTLKVASKILLFDTHTKKLRDTLSLPTGSHGVMGVTISPDGRYAFATHVIGTFAIPATKIEGGWIHTNNVAIVDIKKREILNDVTLDLPTSGVANPWGIDCSPDGKILCVAHSGSNQMSVVDLQQLITIADMSDYSPGLVIAVDAPTRLFHDLTRIAGITDRIKVTGKAPRSITIIGNQVITAGYFDDYLEVFDLVPPNGGITKTTLSTTIDLGPEVRKTAERKGECTFYDASICLQHWASCHSCHPFTRPDALSWILNTPLAAPKNTTSMLYSWWTPPTSWAGRRQNAYESIRAGIRSELFLEPNDTTATDMDTFFMAIKPVPSPSLVKGRLSASALRGKEIYNGGKAACAACHPGPLFTDMKLHNAGIADKYDANTQWDTPSLIECWRTAPYGHLGSKLTIKEMLDLPGMGAASGKLTQDELDDLVEFVSSL